MLIYRVQHERTGAGLYRSSSVANCDLDDLDYRHPMPYKDSALMDVYKWEYFNREHIFGFVSPEQLKFWIYGAETRARIEEEGLHVQVYDAPDAWAGDTQCIFDPRTATKLETIKLTEI